MPETPQIEAQSSRAPNDAPRPAEALTAPEAPAPAANANMAETLRDLSVLLHKLSGLYAAPPPVYVPPPTSVSRPVEAVTRRVHVPEQERNLTRRRLVMLAIVLVATSLVGPALTTAMPMHGYAIASESMEPTLHKGTLVYATQATPQVGEVVVYWSPLANALEVHRVVEIRQEGGETYYVTRGDNNEAADSALVPERDVKGVVRTAIPVVGFLWLAPRMVMVGSFFALVLGYLGVVLWDSGFVRRRLLGGLLAATIVLLVVAPQVQAGVSSGYAKSTETLSVATPPTPLSAGTMASATTSDGGNRATVTADAPKLWKEIVLWGCDPANLNSNPGCHHTTPNAYAVVSGSIAKVDAGNYTPAATFYLEAYLRAPTAGQSTSVQLYDKTGGAAIGPEIVSTSTTLELKRSTAFALTGSNEYQFQTKDSSGGSSGEVRMVKLISVQEFPTKSITHVRVSGAAQSTSNTVADVARTSHFLYDGADLDGTVTVRFEAVAQVPSGSASGAQVRLATTGGTAVSTLDITTSMTSATLVTGSAVTLTNGQSYKVQYKDGGNGGSNQITLHLARVTIVQSSFTKTISYTDLSWRTVVTSTTFAKVGYPARYHMDSDWGDRTAYFEATLLNSNGGQTTTAQLFDDTANAAVLGSSITRTGNTVTRVRSSALTLNEANGTYQVELKGSGTANAEARNVLLIVKQTAGKSYDYALKATNSVGTCTWSFLLRKTADSNMARMTSLTLSLRGDSATQDQIVWSAGAFSQTSGTAVTVAASNTAQVIVTTNPASSGSSSVDADLEGTCGGIHTWQRATFNV